MTAYTDRFLIAYQSLGISDRKFCDTYGINRTSLHYAKIGKREAQVEWLVILAKYFNFSPDWLLLGVGEKKRNEQIYVQEKYTNL